MKKVQAAPKPKEAKAAARTTTTSAKGKALDMHARALIDILKESPKAKTTSELVDQLDLNKSTTINVMKRAVELDPKHDLQGGGHAEGQGDEG